MSRGPYPIMLMLAMSLPGAVRALGLGDIRVDSALNEPLSAQIDIVGATREELAALTASVANREIFQRYGADRPSFLASATFKVGMDAQGHPVLNIRSADPFTDPLVNFLVDLRWGKNEVVREYALLLDPPGYKYPHAAAEVALASVAPTGAPPTAWNTAGPPPSVTSGVAARSSAHAAPAAAAAMATTPITAAATDLTLAAHTRITIAAGETLRGIARRLGARSEAQTEALMIVMFRANPNAFDGNINRLRRGAEITVPSAAEVAMLPGAEARREVRAQMTAWRLDGRPGSPQQVAALSAGSTAAPAATVAAATPAAVPAPVAKEEEAPDASLKNRVQSLEQQLDDVHKLLATENAQIQTLSQAAPPAPAAQIPTPKVAAAPEKAATTNPVTVNKPQTRNAGIFGPAVVAIGLLLAGLAYLRKRLVRTTVDTMDWAPAEPAPAAPTFETTGGVHTHPAIAHSAARHEPESAGSADTHTIEQPVPLTSAEITANLEIDIEALERSYLEGLGTEPATHEAKSPDRPSADPASADAVARETATPTDTQRFASAAESGDLNTVLMDARNWNAPPVHTTALDFDLMDLDSTAQHVQMPSALHDHPVLSERRMNIADVLKMAIERDPGRRDLRMKLLETYYSAASTNRRSFMEVVRKLSREKDALTPAEWKKIMMMGKEIAPDDILFAELDMPDQDNDLASCA